MKAPPRPDWKKCLGSRLDRAAAAAPHAEAWRRADTETIRSVVRGVSPYSGSAKPEAGARVVFNISSAHVPGFAASPPHGGYKNRYEVAAAKAPVGEKPPRSNDVRTRIDEVLSALRDGDPEAVWYGAVELNGAGVRYYGDICLVLKTEAVPAETLLLDRNSFDLICAPLRFDTCPDEAWDPDCALTVAGNFSGEWKTCLPDLAACKILDGAPNAARRITIGSISDGVLSDEDYIEVIRTHPFDASHVAEARTTAADVAAETHIRDRQQTGPSPDWASLMWRDRRRRAETALRASGVPVRVVIGSGRTRS